MADNELTVVRATGETKTLRSRDVGSQVQAQKIDVGPWMPSIAASSDNQYAITAGSAVVTLTVPSGYTHALITVDGADVRYREDGGSPSATNGLFLEDGFIGELPLPNALKFIRAASTDAKINISYRKYV